MWKYVKRYFFYAVLAGLFMIGEVMMDLIQPQIMGQIVDDGVLGLHNGGAGDLDLEAWISDDRAGPFRRILRVFQ